MKCRLCAVRDDVSAAEYDRPFFRSDDYFAIASIGALVPGWSLLCPTQHTTSLRHVYNDSSVRAALSEILARVQKVYGPTVIFEHGSSSCGSLTGCGVDHAHLHVVPLSSSLLPLMMSGEFDWRMVQSSDLSAVPPDREYLFYSEFADSDELRGWMHVLRAPASQYFRKLIATTIGVPERFDYRQYPFVDQTKDTLAKLA